MLRSLGCGILGTVRPDRYCAHEHFAADRGTDGVCAEAEGQRSGRWRSLPMRRVCVLPRALKECRVGYVRAGGLGALGRFAAVLATIRRCAQGRQASLLVAAALGSLACKHFVIRTRQNCMNRGLATSKGPLTYPQVRGPFLY